MKSAIVTGGTGVTGSALVRCLLERGVSVSVLMHAGSSRRKSLPAEHPLLQIVECNSDEYARAAEKLGHGEIDAFFHLAWEGTSGPRRAHNRNQFSMQNRNVGYALDAVELCHALGCGAFVMVGSQAEYGRKDHAIAESEPCEPESGYGMAKLCAESMTRALCAQYGIRHICAILFSVYGPYDTSGNLIDSSVSAILSGEDIPYTGGEQIWDYLYSKDAARALVLLAEKGAAGERYNVANGEARPLREYLADMYHELAPDRAPRLGERPYAPDQVMFLAADTKKLRQSLGFAPEYTFRRGVREIAEWMRKERALDI